MKELLLSERWRPKTLDDVILLPRIRKIFENGIKQNTILYGSFGTGKTSLARILIGLYTKNSPCLPINSSFYTSIDVLRTKIDDFCSKVYMGFDLTSDITQDSTKYVFLDEFERTSQQYQDALKAYIEEFSTKNVRFIFNTNHINKVSPGILSRLIQVNFDCINAEEERYLKTEMYKRISNVIAPKEGITILKEDLVKMINRKFPDFRSIMEEVQYFKETGSFNISNVNINLKLRNSLYDFVYEQKSYEETYHFLMDNFGPEKIDEMISLFGRPFIEYSLIEKRENIDKLFKVNYVICEHTKLLETNTDPIVLGMSVIGKIRELFI
jgi:DNA polymerase III delta prime subunit